MNPNGGERFTPNEHLEFSSKELGRLDLHKMPPEKVEELLTEYKEQFDSLGKEIRTQMLEEFIGSVAISEDEAIELAEKLDTDEREKLGEFVGKNTVPGLYAKLFHDQWDFLDWNTKQEFVQKFTAQNPEGAIMVAPFVDLSAFTISKEDEKAGKTSFVYSSKSRLGIPSRTGGERVSILQKYFNNYESAKQLMEIGLRQPNPPGLKAAFDHFKDSNPLFLYPYLPRLVDTGMITKSEARKFLVDDENESNRYRQYLRYHFFISSSEEKELKEISKKAIASGAQAFDDSVVYEQDLPDNLRTAQLEIHARLMKRGADHTLSNFDEVSRTLLTSEEKISVLKHLATDGMVPVFHKIDQLGLSETEVDTIIASAGDDAEEYVALLEDFDDINSLVKSGREDKAARILIYQISEEMTLVTERLVLQAQRVLPWFSAKNRERIVQSISASNPYAWFYNPEIIKNEKTIDLSSLVRSAEMDGYSLLGNYWRIYHQAKKEEKSERKFVINSEDMPKIAKALFDQSPRLVFWKKDLFKDLYSEGEQKAYMQNQINNDNLEFIMSALKDLSSTSDQISDEPKEKDVLDIKYLVPVIKKSILKNPHFFTTAIEEEYSEGWHLLSQVFSQKEKFELFFNNIDRLDVASVLEENRTFVRDLFSSPKYTQRFFEYIVSTNQTSAASKLAINLKSSLDATKKLAPKVRSEIHQSAIIENRYSELKQYLLEQAMTNKFLVFDQEIIKLNEPEFTAIAEREIQEYMLLAPQAITDISKYLSPELYEKAVAANPRAFAFMKKKWGDPLFDKDKITDDSLQGLMELNPLLKIHALEKLTYDYYKTVLEEVNENPFFSIGKNRLMKIAKEELKRNGPRTNLKNFTPNPEFYDTASLLLLLNSSDDIRAHAETIINLDEKEQKEILAIFEIALLHGLDQKNEFQEGLNLIETNLDEAKKKFSSVIGEYIFQTFDLEKESIERLSFAEIDAEGLQALSIYYNEVIRKSEPATVDFKKMMTEALKGNYETWRASIKDLELLKHESLLPQKLTGEQYEKWVKTDELPLEETLELSERDIRSGINQVFAQAVVDQHINDEQLKKLLAGAKEKYDSLTAPLADYSAELQELKNKIKEKKTKLSGDESVRYKLLQKTISEYKEEHQDEILKLLSGLYLSELKKISLNDLENQSLTVFRKKVPFKKIFETLEQTFAQSNPDFFQDILRIQGLLYDSSEQLFGGSKVSKSSLIITDRVDLKTYIKIGEEPVASCQSYRSTGGLNKGLLSYVVDPNVKIIQLYDESGKIIARSIMRLLEDKNGEPAVFLERIYSSNSHGRIKEAFVKFARAKANSINAKLYSHAKEGLDLGVEKVVKATLQSQGSRSAYVYSDAAGGNMKAGRYTINSAFQI